MKGKSIIKIKGVLDKNWEVWFEGMQIVYEDDNTLLIGEIRDEANLHGVLNTIRDLNLVLVSLNFD